MRESISVSCPWGVGRASERESDEWAVLEG